MDSDYTNHQDSNPENTETRHVHTSHYTRFLPLHKANQQPIPRKNGMNIVISGFLMHSGTPAPAPLARRCNQTLSRAQSPGREDKTDDRQEAEQQMSPSPFRQYLHSPT